MFRKKYPIGSVIDFLRVKHSLNFKKHVQWLLTFEVVVVNLVL